MPRISMAFIAPGNSSTKAPWLIRPSFVNDSWLRILAVNVPWTKPIKSLLAGETNAASARGTIINVFQYAGMACLLSPLISYWEY